MRFTVLGSGTTVPDVSRGPAGFLVEAGGGRWLVDGGSGTLQRCVAAGVDPRTLDGGFYSHHHPDHCADLVPLLFSMRVGPPPRNADYPIWAGRGFATFFSRLEDAFGRWLRPGTGQVRVHELSLDGPDRVDTGALVVHTRPANHAAAALHLRFEADGRSVVFSGDTGASEALTDLATGADLLVCECGSSDALPVEGHLAPGEVADLVDRARPGAVWLTHFYPSTDPGEAVRLVGRTGVPVCHARDLDAWGG